jgi:alpha,alpha-trehalase
LFGYIGGIPASSESRKGGEQQWDFPNVWAPHQSMMVDFLYKNGFKLASHHVGRSFYENVKISFLNYKTFFEKYNCVKMGITGEGGEYPPQEGFGWTNGVMIEFLNIFGLDFLKKFNHHESYLDVIESLNKAI